MKKTILLLLLLAFTFACSNNDDENTPNTNPIEQLPPATQTGANTFGCLLDGVVFKPDNLPNSTNCFYQIVNGEYYFTVRASKKNNDNISTTLALKTEQKTIQEGLEYDLVQYDSGNAFGCFFYGTFLNYTTQTYTGKLTITKLTNQIVSGTFWFDVEDENGVVHQIREGRFDMQYTN